MAEETVVGMSDEVLAQELYDLADGLADIQNTLDQKLTAALREGGDALETFYKSEFHLNKPLMTSIILPQVMILQNMGVSSHEVLFIGFAYAGCLNILSFL